MVGRAASSAAVALVRGIWVQGKLDLTGPTTQRATKPFCVGFPSPFRYLIRRNPVFPYGIFYRRVYGLSTPGLFKHPFAVRCVARRWAQP